MFFLSFAKIFTNFPHLFDKTAYSSFLAALVRPGPRHGVARTVEVDQKSQVTGNGRFLRKTGTPSGGVYYMKHR